MKRFNLYIQEYDWLARVFVAVTHVDADAILDAIYGIGFRGKKMREAEEHLRSRKLNQGVCFSNPDERISVVVIGLTTSGAEFFDSSQHEIGHLATHIALEDGIDLKGEEVRYIQGDFARSMYPYVKDLLCDCCRNKYNSRQ